MGFLSVAIAAFLFSLVDVGRKKLVTDRNTYVTIWGIFLCSLPILIILSFYYGFPEIIGWTFWPLVICIILAISGGEILLFKALKYSDLSDVIPFMAFTPAFLILTSWLILGELPTGGGIGSGGGVVLVEGPPITNATTTILQSKKRIPPIIDVFTKILLWIGAILIPSNPVYGIFAFLTILIIIFSIIWRKQIFKFK